MDVKKISDHLISIIASATDAELYLRSGDTGILFTDELTNIEAHIQSILAEVNKTNPRIIGPFDNA